MYRLRSVSSFLLLAYDNGTWHAINYDIKNAGVMVVVDHVLCCHMRMVARMPVSMISSIAVSWYWSTEADADSQNQLMDDHGTSMREKRPLVSHVEMKQPNPQPPNAISTSGQHDIVEVDYIPISSGTGMCEKNAHR